MLRFRVGMYVCKDKRRGGKNMTRIWKFYYELYFGKTYYGYDLGISITIPKPPLLSIKAYLETSSPPSPSLLLSTPPDP
jgi:hypothetical protein